MHTQTILFASVAFRMIIFSYVQKTMAQGKDYCERKVNLLKSNFDELLEVILTDGTALVDAYFGQPGGQIALAFMFKKKY